MTRAILLSQNDIRDVHLPYRRMNSGDGISNVVFSICVGHAAYWVNGYDTAIYITLSFR